MVVMSAVRPSRISSTTLVIFGTCEVNGAATDASNSESEIPTEALLKKVVQKQFL